jgi:hypothetical protein
MRMNCNIFRALRMGYVRSMIRYCNAWGWKHFWADTFVNWWRVQQYNCPVCGGINHRDRLGKIGFLVCGCIQSNVQAD